MIEVKRTSTNEFQHSDSNSGPVNSCVKNAVCSSVN